MLKNKCSVWKRIKFPTFWYNCYYFTWSDTYFIQLETLLINHPSYETRTDEWHTTWINPRVPFLEVDTERDFLPVVSSFYQIYKADKRRSCYLGTGGALFTHTRNLEVITLARENHVDIICLLPRSSDKIYPWIKFSWSPWKYSIPKKLKNSSVQT